MRPDLLGPLLAKALGDDRWLALEPTLIVGGKSNLTFELTSAAGSVILRRPPSGDLLPSAHDMGREVRIQKALAGTAVPVPRIVLEDTGGDLFGAPFYVMEKVRGQVIREELPAGYAESAAQKRELAFALVDTLADLHAVDPVSVGLGDYGRPDGYLERQLRRWSGQWDKSKTRDVTEVDELRARLVTSVPASQRASIVHGDYRMDNCLMDPADPAGVAAVIDWELSTLGDPLTDLGVLFFYWREPGEEQRALTPVVTTTPGFPSRADLAARYAERTGAALESIAFHEALAHFKFAVIAQGIAARVSAGTMAGQDFGDLDAEVRRIAESGVSLLAQRG
ncbi:phosphotransferase family protein [Planosporangium sp. 12N6]|uniref:phosphotransferase family protein n=1 Tax=Planosporangium spinosum TaxID=3402278 RepID=UPI003CFAAF6D